MENGKFESYLVQLYEFEQMPSVLSITHGFIYNDDSIHIIRIGISEDISEDDLNKILDFKNVVAKHINPYTIEVFTEKKNTDCGGLRKMVYMYDSSMLFNPPNQE